VKVVIKSPIDSARTPHVGEFTKLRPLQAEDAELTLRWRMSSRAFLLHRGAQTVEAQRAWILSRPQEELNFIIEIGSSVPVGMLSLIDIDLVQRNAESARFLIGEEEVVRGLPAAVEAMKLLYHVAFDQLHLLRISGTIAEENVLMLKWQTYLGMKEEGRVRNHSLINGRLQDLILVSILNTDFQKTALPRMNSLIALARRKHESF
jgi:RimJ/RimL family protein N-acetyltransferase